MMERAREQGSTLVNKYEEKLREHNVKGSVHFEVGKPGEVVVGMWLTLLCRDTRITSNN